MTTVMDPPRRSAADETVRRLLRVPDAPVAPDAAGKAFGRSMLISTIRCTLTYLVFPFVLPALGLVSGTGVALGLAIGTVAIVADVIAIRRVFAADHKWRWQFAGLAIAVIVALLVLLTQDIIALAT